MILEPLANDFLQGGRPDRGRAVGHMANQVDIEFSLRERLVRRAERDRAVDIDPGACEQGIFAQPPADGVVVLLCFFGLRWGQLERLAERSWHAYAGSELEFILFDETYDSARAKSWRALRPANAYNVDYSILGTTMVEPVLRQIRLGMAGAGMLVEDSKGECNFGQHEVNFRYQEALRMADDHIVYRNGAKEIAFLHGKALTFMPKYDEREGNSCHIHLSLWEGSESLFPASDGHGMSELFGQFIAGLVRHTRELTLLLAPNVNSYKRFVRGSKKRCYRRAGDL